MNKYPIKFLLLLLAVLAAAPGMAQDAAGFRPFVLASVSETGLEQQAATTTAALEGAGFTVAGHYAPLDNTRVIVVTSPELQAVAARGERGGYGAAQRIGLTDGLVRLSVGLEDAADLIDALRDALDAV